MLKNKKYGIKDIARLANVSIGTVDRVLHKRGRVSELTRKKIEEIICRVNYKPNVMARALVINKKFRIALLTVDCNEEFYWHQVYEGVQSMIPKSDKLGLSIEVYFYSIKSRKSFEEYARKILKSKPDGIIMAPIFLEEGLSLYERCLDLSIPVIMFDTNIPDTKPLTFIGTDSYQGGRVMAELLTLSANKNGKFAILHFDLELNNSPQIMERERGFISYLNEKSPERKYLVRVLNNSQHSYNRQLDEILKKDMISGIFVTTATTYYAGFFLRGKNRKGIILGGYDLVDYNIQLLKTGHIRFLINQNPMMQVEQSIMAFSDFLIYKQPPNPRTFFPIEIIIRNNLPAQPNKLPIENHYLETIKSNT
jgi:LacI family transcriptional regulator